MTKAIELSIDYLRSRLAFEPENGKLYWKPVGPDYGSQWKRWNGKWAAREAGSFSIIGYRIIDILYVKYPAHRLAWAIFYGRWPTDEIDHINLNRADNCIENLREATRGQNMQNRDSWSGFKGVTFKNGKWRARIQVDNHAHHVGVFETEQEAYEAYCIAAAELHGEYARTR